MHMIAYRVLKFEEGALVTEGRNLELLTLIHEQVTALGWQLNHTVHMRKKNRFYNWTLLGELDPVHNAWNARPKIAEGNLMEICTRAAVYLDKQRELREEPPYNWLEALEKKNEEESY
jgi:hypothetical protein